MLARITAWGLRCCSEPRVYALASQIMELEERLKVYDKVDWWDPEYSIDEKRRMLKDSWWVHKLLGTKAAVETAISAVYPETTVEEWFKYGGEPYGFKIHLNLTGTLWSEERPRRILERVEYYKSLRSHLDGMEYERRAAPAELHVSGAYGCVITLPVPEAAEQEGGGNSLGAQL